MPWQISKDQLPTFDPLPFQYSGISQSSFNWKLVFVVVLAGVTFPGRSSPFSSPPLPHLRR